MVVLMVMVIWCDAADQPWASHTAIIATALAGEPAWLACSRCCGIVARCGVPRRPPCVLWYSEAVNVKIVASGCEQGPVRRKIVTPAFRHTCFSCSHSQ